MTEIERRKERAQPFPENMYDGLNLSDLVLYGLFSLHTKGIEMIFENLVVECYELFPKKFHLLGYPEYPDANRVRREIQRIEGTLSTPGMDKLANGNLKTEYKITEKGLERLKEIDAKLKAGTGGAIRKSIADGRGKIGRVLNELEKHTLYRQYLQNGKNTEVPETLLRDLLFATMETSYETLRKKMDKFIEYCEIVERGDLKEFLEFCREKHKNIFVVYNKET